ncbi:MAG: metallophosphoesterase [Lachnospiraceae bacterium]|nr:metallophosphoesterase [Lachnospiraceae bacterium]
MISKDSYRILVVSDTHGSSNLLRKCIALEEPFDLLIHCGDVEDDLETAIGPHEYEACAVKGNCDLFFPLPEYVVRKVGFYNIAAVHGHRQQAGYTYAGLIRFAKEYFADVLLFGHTHVPEIFRDEENGILLVNPGSLARPRQSSRDKTYVVLTISDDTLPQAELKILENA